MLVQELHNRMTETIREIRVELESIVIQYARTDNYGLVVGKDETLKSTLYVMEDLDPQKIAQENGSPKDICLEILQACDEQIS